MTSFPFLQRLGWLFGVLAVGCAGGPTAPSARDYVDDRDISARVKSRLFRDPFVSAFQVQVDTYRGHVQLSGFVDSAEQKRRAGDIAQRVPGIIGVRNDLIVKSKLD